MAEVEVFSYIPENASLRESQGLPYLPILLTSSRLQLAANALLDTGSAINVLPYRLGLQLGLIWEEQVPIAQLTGNLATAEARGVLLLGQIGEFPATRLVFAWTMNENAPLILGQGNFFQQFLVCFDGRNQTFSVRPHDL
jgi:hypothetical protein